MAQAKEREEVKTARAHLAGQEEQQKEKKPKFRRNWV